MLPMIEKLLRVTPGAKTTDRPPCAGRAHQAAIVRERRITLRATFLRRPFFVSAITLTIVAASIWMQGSSGGAHARDLNPSAAGQARGAACPSDNIADFFQAFAESTELQRAYTASTVETAFVDWKHNLSRPNLLSSYCAKSCIFRSSPIESLGSKKVCATAKPLTAEIV